MFDLLREGGVPMVFVVVFGALTLASAGRFAVRGDRRRLGFIAAMGIATLLSAGGGVAADLAAVGHHALERCQLMNLGTDRAACILLGFAESLAPAIVGLTLCSLAAMLAAIGLSRSSRLAAS
jgi:hypothetical protein